MAVRGEQLSGPFMSMRTTPRGVLASASLAHAGRVRCRMCYFGVRQQVVHAVNFVVCAGPERAEIGQRVHEPQGTWSSVRIARRGDTRGMSLL